MNYVYILKTKDGTKYTGSTTDLDRRIKEHEYGKVQYTKHRRLVTLYAYRVFNDIKEAAFWEKKYKRSSGQLRRDMDKGLFQVVEHNNLMPAGQRPEGLKPSGRRRP